MSRLPVSPAGEKKNEKRDEAEPTLKIDKANLISSTACRLSSLNFDVHPSERFDYTGSLVIRA